MHTAARLGKIGSAAGSTPIIIGVGAGYVDVSTEFSYPFISDHFGVFLLATIVGILVAFTCAIGWASHLRRGARAGLAAIVFAVHSLALIAGYPIAGTNIHGPATLLMFMVGPASVFLGLVLLVMAGD